MPNERSALSAALSTIAFVSLLTSPAHADAPTLTTGVPIHITEAYGVARALEPVTFGVPLAEDDPVLVPASELVVAGPVIGIDALSITMRVVSLNEPKRGFASHVDMFGVEFDAGMRFVHRYVDAMRWKP